MSTERSTPSSTTGSWDAVQLLAEPTRRRIYETVRQAAGALSRDEVAARTNLNRRLAAFHLDRLAAAGLLTVSYARPPGRSGPGAGRPAKRFAAVATEVDVSIPPRRYDLAARILAEAIDSTERGDDPRRRAIDVAGRAGRRIGAAQAVTGRVGTRRAVAAATATLGDLGYQPQRADGGQFRLRNCPFDTVVEVAPALVCEANLALIEGILNGLGVDAQVAAEFVGPCDDCCVALCARDK